MQTALKSFRLPYYQPRHYRSDEEQLEEIADVETSLLAEISTYGVLNSQESCFGLNFTYGVLGGIGCCSADMPKGGVWERYG